MQCLPGTCEGRASALAEDAVEVRRAAVGHAQVERAFDVFQVLRHHRAGARGIALLDGVDQLAVLMLGAGRRAGAVVQRDDQAGQRHHLADQFFEDGIAGHLRERRPALSSDIASTPSAALRASAEKPTGHFGPAQQP
ncbi:hypothetical protein AU476_04705 [Cupriavidus sp. UYMSc13B]|nr:hypothetical protein AU476_04705 [Cupriavidus sp. UYMSc13B]